MGGFGISDANDLLLVQDLVLVEQCCSEVTVAFDDEAVADFFDTQFDQGLRPEQFGRIWVHTHPGDSAEPSSVDVETFARVFGRCDWAVMFIIARGGETFAELHWRQGGPARLRMNVEVDYSRAFTGTDHDAWKQEYEATVQREQFVGLDELDWLDETEGLTDFEEDELFEQGQSMFP